jgi:hypothetical protein
MKQHKDHQKRERAERAYAWFLRLYPGAHWRAFGQQMLQTFQDHYRDAIETGSESELRFWLGFLVMFAFVFVSARRNPARPEVNAASRLFQSCYD